MPDILTLPTPTTVPTTVPTVAPPTAQQVYSAANIAQAVTNPVAAPNLSDPYGLYDKFMNSEDIQTARRNVASLTNSINSEKAGLRNTTTGLEYQNDRAGGTTGASMNLIGRQVGRASQLSTNRQAALGEQLGAAMAYLDSLKADAQNRYNIAQNERAQLQDLIRQTNGKAGITYTDSYESALKKASRYQDEVKKQTEKDNMKKTALSLGIKTSGSYKDLEKRLTKYYKTQAGLSEEKAKLELQKLKTDISNSRATGGLTVGQQQGSVLSNAQTALLGSRGTDGKVNPNVYLAQRSDYMKKGGTATDFDKQFGVLLSSNEQKNLGVSTTDTSAENKGTGLTNTQKDDMATMNALIKYAIDLSSKDSLAGVGGLGYGSMANILAKNLGLGTADGQHNRDLIGNIQGTIAKLRGGTSFTENEQRLLETYTPTINDSDVVIKQKLKDISQFIYDKQNQLNQINQGNLSGPTYQSPDAGNSTNIESQRAKYGY